MRVSISGVDETSQSIITMVLFQIMTEFSPTTLIVSTVRRTQQWVAVREDGTGMLPLLIAADRQHSNLKRTFKTRHHTQASH